MKTKRYLKNILVSLMVVVSFSFLAFSDSSIENTKDESIEAVVFDVYLDKDVSEGLEKDQADISEDYLNNRKDIVILTSKSSLVTTITVGSAKKDENGKLKGGQAGDNNKKEVTTQSYYDNNWVVIRAKSTKHAEKIADCMKKACDNDYIGYDQSNRYSVINACKEKGYDPSKITKKVEADCSSLVRLCCLYAGIDVGDFNTSNEKTVLKNTGKFDIIENYTELKRGDILVTKTKGHTVVVVEGNKISQQCPYKEPSVNLKKGSKGEGVRWIQWHLNKLIDKGIISGQKLDIDGQWGNKTEKVFYNFQKKYPNTGTNGKPDGICGTKARKKLKSLL